MTLCDGEVLPIQASISTGRAYGNIQRTDGTQQVKGPALEIAGFGGDDGWLKPRRDAGGSPRYPRRLSHRMCAVRLSLTLLRMGPERARPDCGVGGLPSLFASSHGQPGCQSYGAVMSWTLIRSQPRQPVG